MIVVDHCVLLFLLIRITACVSLCYIIGLYIYICVCVCFHVHTMYKKLIFIYFLDF